MVYYILLILMFEEIWQEAVVGNIIISGATTVRSIVCQFNSVRENVTGFISKIGEEKGLITAPSRITNNNNNKKMAKNNHNNNNNNNNEIVKENFTYLVDENKQQWDEYGVRLLKEHQLVAVDCGGHPDCFYFCIQAWLAC